MLQSLVTKLMREKIRKLHVYLKTTINKLKNKIIIKFKLTI